MKLTLFFLFTIIGSCLYAQTKISGELSRFGDINKGEYFFPIGKFNNSNISKAIKINADSTFTLNLNIKSNAIIKFRFATEIVYLYVEPGNDIHFKVRSINDKNEFLRFLQIKGENAAGSYWYNKYYYLPALNYVKQDGLIDKIKNKNIEYAFNEVKSFLNKETKAIDSLKNTNLVNESFAKIAKQDVYAFHLTYLIRNLEKDIQTEAPGLIDRIRKIEDLIYNNYPPVNPAGITSVFGGRYLTTDYLKKIERDNPGIEKKYSNENYAIYNEYFYLPPTYQEYALGVALLLQKVFSVSEFPFEKGYESFKAKFPSSAYIPVIDNFLKEKLLSNANPQIHFDTISNFNTIKALVKPYEGHNVLIDIWATWCIPCKMEFPYYKSIKDDLKNYDVVPLFVSIDKPLLKQLWQETALQNSLEGYHVIANNFLQKDIENTIFKNEALSIPRYILIDKKGEIIDINAARPSDRNGLIKLFKEKL